MVNCAAGKETPASLRRSLLPHYACECYIDRCPGSIFLAILVHIVLATRVATFDLAKIACLRGDGHVVIRTLVPVLEDNFEAVLCEQMR